MLSPEARSALIRAREEATRHGSNSIDSTHLLLAIAHLRSPTLDLDVARRSFEPPVINATPPTSLHPVLHARLSATSDYCGSTTSSAPRSPIPTGSGCSTASESCRDSCWTPPDDAR